MAPQIEFRMRGFCADPAIFVGHDDRALS